MPTVVNISSLSGAAPFNIYLCDNPQTLCVYIDTIYLGLLPYEFEVPELLINSSSFVLKVSDSNNCIVTTNLTL